MVHQAREKLHGQVFEGQGGPVEELQQEFIRAVLNEWRDRGMPECAVGIAGDASEVVLGDGFADEWTDHLDRDLRIGPASKAGDGSGIEPGPGFGHVEAAVAGEPRQHGLDKAKRRSFPPGRDVLHRLAFRDLYWSGAGPFRDARTGVAPGPSCTGGLHVNLLIGLMFRASMPSQNSGWPRVVARKPPHKDACG